MWALLSLSLLLSDALPEPLAVDVYPSTNATTFTLSWLTFDPPAGVTQYHIYVTPISPRAAAVSVSTNFVVNTNRLQIPNLLYGQTYWIQAQSVVPRTNSVLSDPFAWPQTLTNFAVLSMQQGDLAQHWTNFGPIVVVTNPANYFRISGSLSNNIDPYQKRE